MNIKQMIVTPQHAQDWLQRNDGNRSINRAHVEMLARDMSAGKWKLNGEAIKLNGERLVDGQHRLHACLMAGQPFESVVITNISSEVFDTLDTGKIRNAPDILKIRGEQCTATLAAALRMIHGYLTGTLRNNIKLTTQEIEGLLDEHPGVREYANKYSSRQTNLLPKSVAASLHYLFATKDKTAADMFFTSLIEGIGLEAGSPILQLRNRLIADLSAQKHAVPKAKMGLTIKAWNLYRRGKKTARLQFAFYGDHAERFPRIL